MTCPFPKALEQTESVHVTLRPSQFNASSLHVHEWIKVKSTEKRGSKSSKYQDLKVAISIAPIRYTDARFAFIRELACHLLMIINLLNGKADS